MSIKKESIFLFAGGSGGHVHPALVLKNDLESRGSAVTLFISGFSHFNLEPGILRLKISRIKLAALIQSSYISVYILALFILKRPGMVVGFGGYYSLVGIIVGKILGKRTFIYEPNMILGDTNRLLAPLVDKILVLWPKISLDLRFTLKVEAIRPLLKRDYTFVNKIKDRPFSVLFTGGSAGSLFLNRLFISVFKSKKEFSKTSGIRAVLIAGDSFYSKIKDIAGRFISDDEIDIELYGFRNDMDLFIDNFDLIVSRAGAQIIVESIFSEIPALYIPYPYANQHQVYNARNIAAERGALIFQQKFADKDTIVKVINYFLDNRDSLDRMRSKLKELKDSFNRADKAADIILR
jgi:UDP-N-acetylglucosamine--N-acetylmuramyl-(pentapeptide) pyrophosphoryl-undecaprenol N-acetylglucosamine transferase